MAGRLDISTSILMHKMWTAFLQVAAIVIGSAHHSIHCFTWIMHSQDPVLHKPSTELCTAHRQLGRRSARTVRTDVGDDAWRANTTELVSESR